MVTRSNFDLYQRNLALIQEMYPQYVPLLQDAPAPGYVIEALRPETYTCREGVEGPWRHGPGDPWGETEQAIQEANYTQQSLFLVIRPGLGYMPLSLYPLLRRGRNAQRMLIVEDRIALFRESLHRFDWTDILRSDRTILLLTENPIKAVVDFFVAQPVAMLPPFTGLCGVVVGEQETEIMNRLREVLNDMAHNVFRASEGFLQDLKDHYQAAQQQPLRPKRILLVEPEHEYLADSIGKGFQDEGWLVDTFKGNTRLLRFVNPFIWLVYTRENYPDVLLWMNRNTLSPEGVKLLSSLPIKKVLWFLDNPKRVQTTADELEATDAYFSFDPTYLPYLKDLSGKEGKILPTGAGIEPLSECRPGQNPPPRQGPALGFMGALGAQRFQAVREFWTRKDPEFVRILDELVDAYLAEPSLSLEERYNASPGRDRLPYSGFVVLYLEERATYLHRLRSLAPLAGQGLVTYGGVEWANPEWAEPLCHCYSGQTPRYQEDLPRVYYHTQININLFHAQCVNSLNPRVYDVLAAGGFLLTEYRPALEQEFELGRHLVAFSSPDELREKAAYYLAHPDERDAIARAGQQRVLERYTYRQRVRTLCETIR